MKPTARRNNIFREDLPTEVVLYDKTSHQVHSLNKTVAIVWENADGTRSINALSQIVEEKLATTNGRDLVLSSLDQLSKVGLLEATMESRPEEVVSRRAIARKLVMAGASAAMLPVVATVLAPSAQAAATPSHGSQGQLNADESYVEGLLNLPSVTFGTAKAGNGVYYTTCTGTAKGGTATACNDFTNANKANALYYTAASGSANQTNQSETALTDYTAAAESLGFTSPYVP